MWLFWWAVGRHILLLWFCTLPVLPRPTAASFFYQVWIFDRFWKIPDWPHITAPGRCSLGTYLVFYEDPHSFSVKHCDSAELKQSEFALKTDLQLKLCLCFQFLFTACFLLVRFLILTARLGISRPPHAIHSYLLPGLHVSVAVRSRTQLCLFDSCCARCADSASQGEQYDDCYRCHSPRWWGSPQAVICLW